MKPTPIPLIVLLLIGAVLLSGCAVATPTVTPVAPTGTAMPDTAALAASIQATLPTNAYQVGGIGVIPLLGPDSRRPYWAAYSYGLRNYDIQPRPSHFVAVYTWDATGGWQELARLSLDVDNDTDGVWPDYVDENGVAQALLPDPNHLWVEVQGGAGAHSGTYELLAFDGTALQMMLHASHVSPGFGSTRDLNSDGAPEVVLNVSDPYIFCYACGVRKVMFQVFTWGSEAQELAEVTIEPLAADQQAHPAYAAANRAVELAHAGLWKDAAATIDEAVAVAGATDNATLTWNAILIHLHAEAMVAALADSPYPLLNHIFYGDYAAALEMMRPYTPAEIFSAETPLIAGTVAQGWEQAVSQHIIQSADAALSAEPELAAAWFLRGWARFVADPTDPQAQADVARAAELAPAEPLFAMP